MSNPNPNPNPIASPSLALALALALALTPALTPALPPTPTPNPGLNQEGDSSLLISGSDDTFVHVWRATAHPQPASGGPARLRPCASHLTGHPPRHLTLAPGPGPSPSPNPQPLTLTLTLALTLTLTLTLTLPKAAPVFAQVPYQARPVVLTLSPT